MLWVQENGMVLIWKYIFSYRKCTCGKVFWEKIL